VARLGQVSTLVGLIIAACVIRDIALTSRWAGSRSDVHAGFLRGLVWVYAGTAEPGWFVISSSGRGDSRWDACLRLCDLPGHPPTLPRCETGWQSRKDRENPADWHYPPASKQHLLLWSPRSLPAAAPLWAALCSTAL